MRVVWNDALAICKQAEKLPSNNDLQKLVITQAKKTIERQFMLLVDGKQQVKFALNLATNGVNNCSLFPTPDNLFSKP